MGMRLDLSQIEAEDEARKYINREGEITVKVVKVTFGRTKNNNEVIRVHFQDSKKEYAIDDFVVTDNALWKLKKFTKALKLPNAIDTDMFTNRYVKAIFGIKNIQNQDGVRASCYIKDYSPSNLTNAYEAPQQAPQQTIPDGMGGQVPLINEDEIPF